MPALLYQIHSNCVGGLNCVPELQSETSSIQPNRQIQFPAICEMEGIGSYQDYDELEMLLGEINVTSANPRTENSVPVNSSPNPKRLTLEEENGKSSSPLTFTNYYRASQASSPDKSPTTFYGGLSFERPKAVSVNSFQTSFDQKLQMNGSLEGGRIIMKKNHPSPIKDVCSEGSNYSEDRSLASAFTQLSFKDGVVIDPRGPSQVNSNTSQNCTYLSEGQYPNNLKNSPTSLNSGNKIISSPASPNTLNGMSLLSPTKHNLDNFNVEANDQESLELGVQELKKNHVSCQPLDNLSGDLEEEQRNLPAYSRVVPIAPSSHSFQVLSSAPVHGLEYSATPYQQQQFLDAQSPSSYMQPQDINQSHISWPYIEDERYYRMHQHYLYLQQFQNQGSGAQNLIQENINATIRPTTRNVRQPYYEMPFSHQLEQTNKVQLFDNAGTRWKFNPSEITVMGDGHRYYAQEFSGREASCPFLHDQKQTSMNTSDHSSVTLSAKDFEAVQVFDKVGKHTFPEKILTRSHGLNSLRAINPGSLREHTLSPNHPTTNGRLRGNDHIHQHTSILNAGSFQLRGVDGPDLRHSNSRLLPQKYNSVDEVVGRIYLMAKDQHGCRFLQRKLTEGNVEDVNKIFFEIIDHIAELVTDPFGNYLVQKLLEVCNENQRTQMLHAITRTPGDLVRISSDMHGTRAVQKVIETLKTPEQFSIVVSSLKPGILTLIKDMNGNHVAQRCFQYLIPRYSEFLFQAVIANFIELATDRHGCCVLQKCLSHSDGEQRRHLIYEITSNALILSQDPFGNYVVQYVFDLRIQWAIAKVLDQLDGNYGYLSMQKYSSNVVEKCLRYAGEERRSRIIQELISHSRLDQISQHPFGNYVVQAALNHSKGAFHAALVETLEPHVAALRTSPFGKKVLSCISLKK